jgi:hypothetical protein
MCKDDPVDAQRIRGMVPVRKYKEKVTFLPAFLIAQHYVTIIKRSDNRSGKRMESD